MLWEVLTLKTPWSGMGANEIWLRVQSGERPAASVPLAARERSGNLVKDRGDDALDIALIQVLVALCKARNQF